mmetsp:Transcript_85559/g.276096  ORF Transcript_85559/g.276096 Transcript_85559/m.276096 type:complete len:137 (+) Transcript_85559:986-1396(+)
MQVEFRHVDTVRPPNPLGSVRAASSQAQAWRWTIPWTVFGLCSLGGGAHSALVLLITLGRIAPSCNRGTSPFHLEGGCGRDIFRWDCNAGFRGQCFQLVLGIVGASVEIAFLGRLVSDRLCSLSAPVWHVDELICG